MGKSKYTNLKKIRTASGLTQQDVADILGMSLLNYQLKERGKVKIFLDEAKVLSELFDKPIEELFDEAI